MTCNKQELIEVMYEVDKELGQAFYFYYAKDYQNLNSTAGNLLLSLDQLESNIQNKARFEAKFRLDDAKECLIWVKSDLHNKKYKNAFYDLDRFRYKLISFRSENDIDYAMDYLWDIEALIEIVTSTIALKNDCPVNWFEYVDVSLCLQNDFDQFKNLLRKQQDVSKIQILNPFYKISLNNMQFSIDQFEDAVTDTNYPVLKNSIKQMNRDYLNLLYTISFEYKEDYVALN